MALITRVNSPRVRMRSGKDTSQSSGRSRALKLPSNNDATNSPVRLSHSIPGTTLAATITATVLISHRCKKFFKGADILLGRLTFRQLTAGFIQPFDLIGEKVFSVDSIDGQAGLIVLLFVDIELKQAEVKRGGLHSIEFF